MRRGLLVLLVCVGLARSASAATITAASCSLANVQTAVAAAAVGDTVQVPAGSCTWTSQLSVSKGITLLGAGVGVTIITDAVPKDGGGTSSLMLWSVSTGQAFRISSFSLIAGICDCSVFNKGMVALTGSSHSFRIDHVAFSNLNDQSFRNAFIRTTGYLWGVIDHNDFRVSFQNAVLVGHDGWGGSAFGDGSWTDALYLGTEKAVYIEDNTFREYAIPFTTSVVDSVAGGRYVFRHNTVQDSAVATHGTESSQRFRSVRSYEIYNNTLNYACTTTNGCLWAAIFLRGGTGVVFNNTFRNNGVTSGNPASGFGSMIRLWVDRDDQGFPPWDTLNHDYASAVVYRCDGTSPFDKNTPGGQGYRCIDQPGSGTSIDLHGTDPPAVAVVNNTLDPIYQWNNDFAGAAGGSISVQGAYAGYHLQGGRDYYDATQRPGYTPYTYPHPLTMGGTLPTPPPGPTTIVVHSGGDLQAAINSAALGDTIVLDSGATFTGNFILPVKSGSDYLTITSSTGVPIAGVRVAPNATLAKIQAPAGGASAIATALGAHHYALVGLEFLPNPGGFGDIIELGSGGADQNVNTTGVVAHDLRVDRCYIHGVPQKRGIALNSASTTIQNSYISNIRVQGQDSQAIGGWNGPGPFLIYNNYLEAASENVMFGGGDPSITNLVPDGITIQANYFFKPLTWQAESGWNVKNLFELKNAQNVLIEGNTFENSWVDGQIGWGVVLTVRNQDGACTWCTIANIEVRYNQIINTAAAGVAMDGWDFTNTSAHGTTMYVHDNLLVNTGRAFETSRPFLPTTITHNTVSGANGRPDTLLRLDESYPDPSQLTYQNNIALEGLYGITGDGACTLGTGCFFAQAPNGVFNHNVIERGSSAITYTGTNYLYSPGGVTSQFDSTYHYSGTDAATDAQPIGADIDTILAWHSGVGLPPVPPLAPTNLRILP